jgi:hypothetical protein
VTAAWNSSQSLSASVRMPGYPAAASS